VKSKIRKNLSVNSKKNARIGWPKRIAALITSFVNSTKTAKIDRPADSTICKNQLLISPNLKLFVVIMKNAKSQDVHLNIKRSLSYLAKVSVLIKKIEAKTIQDLNWKINRKYAGLIKDAFVKIVTLNILKETLKTNKKMLETISRKNSRLNI
jgi:hypothetical protein